jgi:cold shock CspA family protein
MEPFAGPGSSLGSTSSRGYGFVVSDNADDDVFLHQSEWHDPLPVAKGLRVSFRIGL